MKTPFDLTGQAILVTGASSGIGRATAIVLSRLGARLWLVGRNVDRLEATRQALTVAEHICVPFDLNVFEEIPIWLQNLAAKHGRLDGLVNCAGVHNLTPLKTMGTSQVESLWRINVSAGLWLLKGFRHRTVNNAGGSVVLVSSVAGLVGQAAISAYAASKGAIIAMTKSAALELVHDNIRVNCLAPGFVQTEMTIGLSAILTRDNLELIQQAHPLGLGQPEDVAHAAAFLLSSAARWITGSVLVVDGGYTAR